MPASNGEGTASKMAPENKRPEMPTELVNYAIEGNRGVLLKCLGLPADEPISGGPDHIQVQIDATETTLQQILEVDIRSETKSGNNILHLLVTHGHNDLALKVFEKNKSLLTAQNKKLETPLHCAVKVGNDEFICNLIEHNSDDVKHALAKDLENNNGDTALHVAKDALAKGLENNNGDIALNVAKDAIAKYLENNNSDTALHVAARHGNTDVGCKLMKLSPKTAYKVNKDGSPLHIAIANGYTEMAKAMLSTNATIACIEDSDGMFPVHVATRMGNKELVKHFIINYLSYAKLLDPRGRNLFHIAAENNCGDIFQMLCSGEESSNDDKHDVILHVGKEIKQMMSAKDYDGNTPLHIAAMKGHKLTMRAIWEKELHQEAEEVENKQGLKPLELSRRQLEEANKGDNDELKKKIDRYVSSKKGCKFTGKWFDKIMEKDDDERKKWFEDMRGGIMVVAVLVASVTYTTGLSPPGGFWQDDNDGHRAGTAILKDRFPVRYTTFFYSNATAFMASLIIIILLMNENFYTNQARVATLNISMVLDLVSLMIAYATGCARHLTTSIYVIVVAVGIFSFVVLSSSYLQYIYAFAIKHIPYLEKIAGSDFLKNKSSHKTEKQASHKTEKQSSHKTEEHNLSRRKTF